MRLPLAPPTMRRPPAGPTPQPRGQHPPPERFVIHGDAVFRGQVLGRERRAKPLAHASAVFGPDQRDDPRAQARRPRPIRPPPRTPMLEPFRTALAIPVRQPLRLPVT